MMKQTTLPKPGALSVKERRTIPVLLAVLATMITWGIEPQTAHCQIAYRTVFVTQSGSRMFPIYNTAINNEHDILLQSSGIYLQKHGQSTSIMVTNGDPVPGISGASFGSFDDARLSSAGSVAFVASLQGVPTNAAMTVWLMKGTTGEKRLVAREDDPAGGASGTNFGCFFSFLGINDNDEVTFLNYLRVGGIDGGGGLFGPLGSEPLSMVACVGSAPPGTTGVTYSFVGGGNLSTNEVLPFVGNLAGAVTGSDNRGIWTRGPDGIVRQVARGGISAPGIPNAVLSENIGPSIVNRSGAIAFTTEIIAKTGMQAIYRTDSFGGLQLLACTGQSPSNEPDVVVTRGVSKVALNGRGDVAFVGSLQSTNGGTASKQSVMSVTSERGLYRIAKAGDTVPMLDGLTFRTFWTILGGGPLSDTPVNGIALNNAGDVAFLAQLAGSGVSTNNDWSIWLYRAESQQLSLIAREGDAYEAAPGDVRIILRVHLFLPQSVGNNFVASGGEDSQARYLTDDGELVFGLGFGDSAGVFAAMVSVAPAPQLAVTMVEDGTLHITWTARSTERYQMQQTTNLHDWIPFGDPVAGADGQSLTVVATPTGNNRFYRLSSAR